MTDTFRAESPVRDVDVDVDDGLQLGVDKDGGSLSRVAVVLAILGDGAECSPVVVVKRRIDASRSVKVKST